MQWVSRLARFTSSSSPATSVSAFGRLSHFADNVRIRRLPVSEIPAARTMRSLYRELRQTEQLNDLNGPQMSTLLSVFAHCAQTRPHPSTAPFHEKNLIRVSKHARDADSLAPVCWDTVIDVGTDMVKLQKPLQDSDHAFMLRAYLYHISSDRSSTLRPDDPRPQWATEARHHYKRIQHHDVWDLHCSYFSCLLDMPQEYHRQSGLFEHISQSLDSFPILSDRFFAVLIRTLLQYEHIISEEDKRRLLRSIRTRCATFFQTKWKEAEIQAAETQASWGGTGSLIDFVKSMFKGKQRKTNKSHTWLQDQLEAALADRPVPGVEWNNLMFFANYFVQQERSTQSPVLSSSPGTSLAFNAPFALEVESHHLRNIFFLAEIERHITHPSPSLRVPVSSIAHLIQPVWEEWEVAAEDRPKAIDRAVLCIFFTILHQHRDHRLFRALLTYCNMRDLFHIHPDERDVDHARLQIPQLISAFAVATFVHDRLDDDTILTWPSVFAKIREHVIISPIKNRRIGFAMVAALAKAGMTNDAMHLYDGLLSHAPASQPPTNTILPLAFALARSNQLSSHRAADFLAGKFSLSEDKRYELLQHILTGMVENGAGMIPSQSAVSISRMLLSITQAHLDPNHQPNPLFSSEMRRHTLLTLPTLVHSKCASDATAIFLDLLSFYPAEISPPTWYELMQSLLHANKWQLAYMVQQRARTAYQEGLLTQDDYHVLHRQALCVMSKKNVPELPFEIDCSLPSKIIRTPAERLLAIADYRLCSHNSHIRLSEEKAYEVEAIFEENQNSHEVVSTAMTVIVNAGRINMAERMLDMTLSRMVLTKKETNHLCTILLQGRLMTTILSSSTLMPKVVERAIRRLTNKYGYELNWAGVGAVLRIVLRSSEQATNSTLSRNRVRRLFAEMFRVDITSKWGLLRGKPRHTLAQIGFGDAFWPAGKSYWRTRRFVGLKVANMENPRESLKQRRLILKAFERAFKTGTLDHRASLMGEVVRETFDREIANEKDVLDWRSYYSHRRKRKRVWKVVPGST
ncbi:hypothetical protein DL96DRAFT_1587070 [Flagelloscypha sp. PMI_526]|nr:hypothetical protein DL96DRAFT_1587070 [Flagelloscypha sp. PMI_526]